MRWGFLAGLMAACDAGAVCDAVQDGLDGAPDVYWFRGTRPEGASLDVVSCDVQVSGRSRATALVEAEYVNVLGATMGSVVLDCYLEDDGDRWDLVSCEPTDLGADRPAE